MKPGVLITKLWEDDDLVELKIRVMDESSSFANKSYVGHADLKNAAASLYAFKDRTHRGLCDLRFGEFGPEYAKGAFHARFHFPIPGRLVVSCEQESEFMEFAKKVVASRATMFLRSEPGLLDRFIAELSAVSAGTRKEAFLEAV